MMQYSKISFVQSPNSLLLLALKQGSVLAWTRQEYFDVISLLCVIGNSKYVPPAIRNQLSSPSDALVKKVRGLLNKVAESNLHSIAPEIVRLWMYEGRSIVASTLVDEIIKVAYLIAIKSCCIIS